mgnify:CR=1 FL=1
MKKYTDMSLQERQAEYAAVQVEYEKLKAMGLSLNMARGKPGKAQLDLVTPIFSLLTKPEDFVSDGIETRNYGEVSGIPAAKALFADILGCKPEQVFVGGNASLQLMYDAVSKAFTNGLLHSSKPWCKLDKVKWICPVPGYDRHFAVTEYFGIQLIAVPMTETGPDMDEVERLVADPLVKGIWCVPMYSNPGGVTYSDDTVRRLAAMETAAPDFRIMWDNAYGLHHLSEEHDELLNLYEELKKCGHEDRAIFFCSTSKISFPGAGVAALAASPANIADIKKRMNFQTIGYDKINMLRHVRYFHDRKGLEEHMKLHAAVLRPKFDAVLDTLEQRLGGKGVATWRTPRGGYFVSVDLADGCAKKTVQMLKEAGVVLTGAGATYPYGKDPHDSNLRLAPSYPPVEELKTAMALFCICAELVYIEQLLAA